MGLENTDINQQTFTKEIFGGFNKKAVNEFKVEVSGRLKELNNENQILRNALEDKNKEISELKIQIKVMEETDLLNAKELKETKVKLAFSESQLLRAQSQILYFQEETRKFTKFLEDVKNIREEAQKEAKVEKQNAKKIAKEIIEKAKKIYILRMAEMQQELDVLKHNYKIIDEQTIMLTNKLSKLLTYSMNKLNNVSNTKEVSFIEKRIAKIQKQLHRFKNEE